MDTGAPVDVGGYSWVSRALSCWYQHTKEIETGFASIYRTLGARVTLVEEKENLLPS